MDQFEAISKKNRRITRVVLGIPLLIVIVLVAGLFLLVVVGRGIMENESLQREIFEAEDLTPEQAESYLARLTGDDDMDSSTVGYNVALAKIHIEKGDYDQAIEVCSSAITAGNSSPFYNYYLGMAYLNKGLFDEAKNELIKVTVADAESFYESALYDSYTETEADSMRIKKETQSTINLIDLRKNVIDASADAKPTKEGAASYISRFKAEDEFAKTFLGNSEFVHAYLSLCVSARDFEEIKRIVPRAVAIKDDALYHYDLALAYAEAGDTFDEVAEEIEIFFAKNTIADSAKEQALLRETVFNNFAELYYERDKYDESKKLTGYIVEEEMAYASGIRLEVLKEFKSVVLEGKPYDAEILIDIDGDGMGDELEKKLGTDPTRKDSDGDGYEDEKEIIFGHDPLKKSPDDKLGGGYYYRSYYAQIPNIEPGQQVTADIASERILAIMTGVPMFMYEHNNY